MLFRILDASDENCGAQWVTIEEKVANYGTEKKKYHTQKPKTKKPRRNN